ncbi:MAG TPA: EamA family transporter [Puia sp.]|nr:EamA family transporter [Puia sp.]
MKQKTWLLFALLATAFCGVWGALIEIPEKAGFPASLGYVVWALTMIIPCVISLKIIQWKLEVHAKAIRYGLAIGLLGAAGQLILFQALKSGPAYLVFPFVSLSPLITILLSIWLLKERASRKAWAGIILALVAIPLLSYQPPSGIHTGNYLWILYSLLVFLLWGIQAYLMKIANDDMKAESIFFYMMVAAIALIPVAIWMTDFSKPINWGMKGPAAAAAIQVLNAIGALFIVYAFRYGRAIIVSPLVNAGAPVITIILSLALYSVFPQSIILTGMLLAIAALYLLAT